jgi:hypothetical protein
MVLPTLIKREPELGLCRSRRPGPSNASARANCSRCCRQVPAHEPEGQDTCLQLPHLRGAMPTGIVRRRVEARQVHSFLNLLVRSRRPVEWGQYSALASSGYRAKAARTLDEATRPPTQTAGRFFEIVAVLRRTVTREQFFLPNATAASVAAVRSRRSPSCSVSFTAIRIWTPRTTGSPLCLSTASGSSWLRKASGDQSLRQSCDRRNEPGAESERDHIFFLRAVTSSSG